MVLQFRPGRAGSDESPGRELLHELNAQYPGRLVSSRLGDDPPDKMPPPRGRNPLPRRMRGAGHLATG